MLDFLEKQQLLLVGNQTPMEVSYIMVNNNQAKRGAEEAIVKRIESPIKNEEVNINKSPMKSIYEETNSENIISSYSKDESKDENAIKQLLGDDEITSYFIFIFWICKNLIKKKKIMKICFLTV